MGHHSRGGNTFLGRLIADRGGNTLAIAAASLLPMMALIGGGVDVSRAYMAKTQLQSACDAGVLAGRKAMSKTGVYQNAEKAKATKMFNFNFSSGALDAEGVTFNTQDNAAGQVLGTATATVPTLVMKIFKMDTVDLSVDCMAELQIGNADIMFVLDTTGSMDDPINSNDPKKIVGLRDAVRDFHKTIKSSVNDPRTRIRYGFVPYSQTVNVSDLLLDSTTPMPLDYLTSTTSYQSRVAEFSTSHITAPWNPNTPTDSSSIETYSSSISKANCQTNGSNYGNNKWPSGSGGTPVNGGGPASSGITTTVTTYTFLSWTQDKTGSNGTCKRTKKVTTTTYTGTQWYRFTRWIYRPELVDTSVFKTGVSTKYGNVTVSTTLDNNSRVRTSGTYDLVQLANMVAAGTAANISTTSNTWNGCIEERDTTPASSSYDFDPIPDDAYDLDFDYEPDSDATRWRPIWPSVYVKPPTNTTARSFYYNASDGKYYTNTYFNTELPSPPTSTASTNCPYKMELLKQIDLKDSGTDVNGIPLWLENYVNALVPAGSTYHDIGMEWGGRLTSSTGIFAENVNKDADKISVSKHIIFMTDGKMEPSLSTYSAYGVEELDHRIGPSGATVATDTARHNARFTAVCEAIKAQGTTIWVVAFGTTMTTQLQNCASDGRAYYSSNTTALRNTFKFIAAQVADLRLGA